LEGSIQEIILQWAKIGGDAAAKLNFLPHDRSIKREDRVINSSGMRVRIYHPPGSENTSKVHPLCIYIHGGGWALGDLDTEDDQCSELCRRLSLLVVSIDYRLAPKHKAPIPLNDCIEGYLWAIDQAGELSVSRDHILIAGGSAGANLAIATTLNLIDRNDSILPKGLLALAPVTIDPRAVPDAMKINYTSYEEKKDTGPNTPSGMRGFIGKLLQLPFSESIYLNEGSTDAYGSDPHDKYFSVLLHDKLDQLPKTYVAVCSEDTLRDDGRLFVKALENSGYLRT
jgi:versiconal hemiacetal acetate esterase